MVFSLQTAAAAHRQFQCADAELRNHVHPSADALSSAEGEAKSDEIGVIIEAPVDLVSQTQVEVLSMSLLVSRSVRRLLCSRRIQV